MRSIFDEGSAGMVLIGMPGIEKRIARFPQFYSRIGFVHEFRPLDPAQVRTARKEMDTGRRYTSRRTTPPGGHSEPYPDDGRKLQTAHSAPDSDRAGSRRQRPSSGLDSGRRSGAGQPRHRPRMTSTTPNNSET